MTDQTPASAMVLEAHEWRKREVQAIGAAISLRSWHDLEVAYNSLRDKMDRAGCWNPPAAAPPAPAGRAEVALMTPTNPQDGVELKPCGNCAAPARWVEAAWRIKCTRPSCGVEGGKFERRTDAFVAWNARTPAQPVADAGSTSATPFEPATDAVERAAILDAAERNWNHGPDALADAILAALRTAPSERAGIVGERAR